MRGSHSLRMLEVQDEAFIDSGCWQGSSCEMLTEDLEEVQYEALIVLGCWKSNTRISLSQYVGSPIRGFHCLRMLAGK